MDERSGVDAKGVQSLAVVGHLRLIGRLDACHPGLGRHGVHDRPAVLAPSRLGSQGDVVVEHVPGLVGHLGDRQPEGGQAEQGGDSQGHLHDGREAAFFLAGNVAYPDAQRRR